MTRRVVGILGGMGPEATILLQQRVLAQVEARDDADHLPLLIDMNPQVPSRIAHLIQGDGENPGPVLAEMAQRLQQAGATALAMPCNTAHHYAPFIANAVSIPFLDMVSLSVAAAGDRLGGPATVGILASPAVKLAGVFDAPLRASGLTALWPEDTDRMLTAIKMIKSKGATPKALTILADTASELTLNGAGLLFIACSEFSLMTQDLDTDVPVIDTVDTLASAIRDHTIREMS